MTAEVGLKSPSILLDPSFSKGKVLKEKRKFSITRRPPLFEKEGKGRFLSGMRQ